MPIKTVLAGNSSHGKTTLFNGLTGPSQFVENWPGVTAEKKERKLKGNKDVIIMDLPGICSLSPYMLEEAVVRSYLITQRPDAILNIVDGTNLECSLHLTTQLMELGILVLMAVNVTDVARKNEDRIDIQAPSRELGYLVVEISASEGTGITEAANKAVEFTRDGRASVPVYKFCADVEAALEEIE